MGTNLSPWPGGHGEGGGGLGSEFTSGADMVFSHFVIRAVCDPSRLSVLFANPYSYIYFTGVAF